MERKGGMRKKEGMGGKGAPALFCIAIDWIMSKMCRKERRAARLHILSRGPRVLSFTLLWSQENL